MIAVESVVSKLSGSFAEWSSSMCRSPAPDIRWHDRFQEREPTSLLFEEDSLFGPQYSLFGFRDSLFH
jgi:hypothetical protein